MEKDRSMYAPKCQFPIQVALVVSLAFGFIDTSASAAAICVGSCGSLGPDGVVVAPPGGGTYGWISTFGGLDGVGQLPGLPAGSTNGSTFTTSAFAANAGDSLKYQFNFVTSDGQFLPDQFIYEDYAWVQLLDAATGNPLAMLFNARAYPTGLTIPGTDLPPIDPTVVLNPSSVPITPGAPNWTPLGSSSGTCWGPGCGFTGWVFSDYTVPNSGNYLLEFGVSNWGDTAYDSGLAFNGLQIGSTPIGESELPEPLTLPLFGAGLAGAVAMRRRKKKST